MTLLVLILSNQAFAQNRDSNTTKSGEGASQAQRTFTLEEIVGVCNIIREYNSAADTPAQLDFVRRQHNLSESAFFGQHIDQIICHQKHVVFMALDNEREDFMSIIEADTGKLLNRPLPNPDGSRYTPVDYLFEKMRSASDKRIEGKYRVLIFKLKQQGFKTCKELGANNCQF